MAKEADDEGVVSLKDLEDDSNEDELVIYGGCEFEPECSFVKGYVKRQALYVCETCKAGEAQEPAAVCYHCSVTCHEGHDLSEIYTKRNFRCDCGNKKFPNKCLLWEDKDDENKLNQYGQNFKGVYCLCKKPHPEFEEDEREMFQCCLCEDWFHLEHVNHPSSSNDTDEFTCPNCLKKNNFLLAYKMTETHERSKRPTLECKLDQRMKEMVPSEEIRGEFWPADWRETILCRCEKCLSLYRSLHLDFLMDPEDTLHFYTEVAEKRVAENRTQNDRDLKETLTNLPRPVAIDLVHGINDFREAFQSLIREKENTGDNIIREADIKKIFEHLEKNRDRVRKDS